MNDFLVAIKTPKVYKNKKLNNATFNKFNLNDYQVFLQLISKLGKVNKDGKYTQPNQLERSYTLTAQEFAKHFHLEVKHAYKVIKQTVQKLMKSSITLEKPELKKTWEINICSMAEYCEGEGRINIKFTDDIMPYLSQVKAKFVLYNLSEVSFFNSLYSVRLYELIQEFKTTGWFTKTIEQLRTIFAVGTKFSKYNDFKKRSFAHACEEINKKTGFNVKFLEIKEGRRIVAINFNFDPVEVTKTLNKRTRHVQNTYQLPVKNN